MAKKILIIDDSSAMRESLSFIIQEAGFETATAQDGMDGLSKATAAKYDLILTDVNMPNMDGITFIKKARETSALKFTPIVVLTTESQNSKMEEGKSAGATGWIVKPFESQKLIQVVQKLTSQ